MHLPVVLLNDAKMSGEPIVINLDMAMGTPSSFPVVLKKIMEMPPPNILDGDDGESQCHP